MGFQKGHKLGKGRPKGSVNKSTMAEAACIRAGIDPFDLLVKAAMKNDISAIIQLCKHIEPPRKPIDMAMDPENNAIRIIVEDYTAGK